MEFGKVWDYWYNPIIPFYKKLIDYKGEKGKFKIERTDQLEKQRKDLEEREMLLKAAKVRSFVMYE